MKWQEYNSRVLGAMSMKENMHKVVAEAGIHDFSESQLHHLHTLIQNAFFNFKSDALSKIEKE